MALSAAEATLNTASDTFMAAWVTYTNTLALDATTQIVFANINKGDNANNSKYHDLAANKSAFFDARPGGVRERVKNNPDVTGTASLSAGGKPLFFKITNDAGDLT